MKIKKNIVLMLIFIFNFYTIASANNISKVNFKKADNYFISGNYENALRLYNIIINKNDDQRLVELSMYKAALIYDNRLAQYENAVVLYKKFIRRFPVSNLARLARKRVLKIESLINKNEIKEQAEFRTMEKQFFDLFNKSKMSTGKVRNLANGVYNFVVVNTNLSFYADILKSSILILTEAKMYRKAIYCLQIMGRKFPAKKELYIENEEYLRMHILRKNIYYISVLYLLFIIVFSIIVNGWKKLFKNASYLLKKYLYFFFFCLGIFFLYYFLIGIRGDNYKFNIMHPVGMVLLFISCMLISLLFNNSIGVIKNFKLRFSVQIILSSLIGLSCWLIFSYHLDFMWLLGL